MGRLLGNDLIAHTPLDAVRGANGRRLVFVHGAADRRVSIRHHHMFMAVAAQQPGVNVSAWIVDHAGHAESSVTSPADYEQQLVRFFQELLLP